MNQPEKTIDIVQFIINKALSRDNIHKQNKEQSTNNTKLFSEIFTNKDISELFEIIIKPLLLNNSEELIKFV